MLAILRDLLRYNAEFRIGALLVGFVLVLSCSRVSRPIRRRTSTWCRRMCRRR